MGIATVLSAVAGGLSSKYGLSAMFLMTAANTGMNIAEIHKLKNIENGVNSANAKLKSLDDNQKQLVQCMSEILNEEGEGEGEAPKKTSSMEGELMKFFLESIKEEKQKQDQQEQQNQKNQDTVTREEFDRLCTLMTNMNNSLSKIAATDTSAPVKEELPAATIGGWSDEDGDKSKAYPAPSNRKQRRQQQHQKKKKK